MVSPFALIHFAICISYQYEGGIALIGVMVRDDPPSMQVVFDSVLPIENSWTFQTITFIADKSDKRCSSWLVDWMRLVGSDRDLDLQFKTVY